jgi:arylamine N-acetyltransferase
MATYTEEQIARYLAHIGYHEDVRRQVASNPLGCLAALQKHHMARVPFESLSLHYSKSRLLSLNPEDLFAKIVYKGRGGYCMEVNTFFATVLRSVGFTLISTGGRVKKPHGYTGWYAGLSTYIDEAGLLTDSRDHMVNLVTIEGKRYLVDVGFGSHGPPHPVPLEHDYEFVGVAPMRGRLEYRSLEEHTDPNQRVWLYSVQDVEGAPWRVMYHFGEVEFIAGDFEVMNLTTMSTPQSFFVQSVMCMCTLFDEQKETPVGLLILHRGYVKRRVGARSQIIEQLGSEEQRVKALKKYFGIVLSQEEQNGIRGLASELRGGMDFHA